MTTVRLEQVVRMDRAGNSWRVYLENRINRNAFYEVSSCPTDGACLIRYGSIGSVGQRRTVALGQGIKKIGEKLGGNYNYPQSVAERLPSVRSAPEAAGLIAPSTLQPRTPRAPQAAPVRTLRDRMASTSMRPITMDGFWRSLTELGLVKQKVDTDYTDVFPRCTGLVVYQATKGNHAGKIYVVVQYGDEMVWGCAVP